MRRKIAAIDGDASWSALAKEHATIDEAVLAETAKLHSDDEENLRLWHEFLPHCREEIQKLYSRLDVQFDYESGEGDSTGVARDRDRTVVELARATIEDVDLALAKIDEGTYGRCEHCGESIPRARLEALPAARLCLDCKGNPRGHGLSTLSHRQHRPTSVRR